MDKFKKSLQMRLVSMSLYTVALVIMAVKSVLNPSAGETEEVRAFMTGMNAGLFAVVLVALAAAITKCIKALKDEDKRKALYIYENDERRLYIKSKMGGDALQLVLLGLVAATGAAEFYNQTVFFTLLSALLFTAAVKAVFKIVYTKKLT